METPSKLNEIGSLSIGLGVTDAVSGCNVDGPLDNTGVADLQGSAIRQSPGLVNFVTVIAYHICLALPAALTQPGVHLLVKPCK